LQALAKLYSMTCRALLSKFLNFSFRILTLSLGGLLGRLEHLQRNCLRAREGEIRNKEKFASFQTLCLEAYRGYMKVYSTEDSVVWCKKIVNGG
jgi:hypothetical protein